MRVSYKWLKEYSNFEATPQELADKLTLAGLEVDEIEYLGQGIENVVVGEVKDKQAHPQSSKLSLCQVDDGQNLHLVVCGAPNVAVGQKVPLALPGAKLPNGMEIAVTQVAGVESAGMICSGAELGLNDEDDQGIMVLPEDLSLGVDIVEAMELEDAVLILDLTPNRSDCLGMLNVAREAAAVTGSSFQLPTIHYGEKGGNVGDYATIEVEDKDLCPRYLARLVLGLKIGPSPLWMQRYLLAAGMRPINNVVDISNFVMLETGQPSHTFDYQKLAGHKIVVRRAKPGEKMFTLDGKERSFTQDTLLICDGLRPVCIAGVMGGLDSEVTEATTDILIETACFDPVSIRRTSRSLNLISESSLRFEKGLDIEGCNWASRRIVQLMLEYCGGISCAGYLDERIPKEPERVISLHVEKVNAVLGTDYTLEEVAGIMHKLAFPLEKSGEGLLATIPYYRGDITIEEDLIEEVARLRGYGEIPAVLPPSSSHGLRSRSQQILLELRRACAGLGLREVINYSFHSPKDGDKLRLSAEHTWRKALMISNPLSEEQSMMRTQMLAGMLQTAARNHSRRNLDLALCEFGACFMPQAEGEQPEEVDMLAIALSGAYGPGWQGQDTPYDYFYLKGLWESLAERFQLPPCRFEPVSEEEYPFLHPGRSAVISCNERVIGFLGEIHPQVLEEYELEKPLYFLQAALDIFTGQGFAMGHCQDLPRFPASYRDMALVGSADIPAADIMAAIQEKGGPYLQQAELFDLYAGAPIPAGERSLAFSLSYQNPAGTLTDGEINQSFDEIVAYLGQKWNLHLR